MNMQRGDHISSSRIGYSHHGIYLGDGQVIHYAGYANGPSAGKVEIVSIEDFAAGNGVRVAAHPLRLYGAEETIRRACSRLGEDLYSLFLNNCEHFVFWCLYGVHWSRQVTTASALMWTAARYAITATASKTGELLVARSAMSGVASILGKSSAMHGCATVASTQAVGAVSTAAKAVVAKAVVSTASTSVGGSVAAAAAGLGAGTATAAATGTAGAITAGLVGGAGVAAAATAAAPVLIVAGIGAGIGVGIGYVLSEIFDW